MSKKPYRIAPPIVNFDPETHFFCRLTESDYFVHFDRNHVGNPIVLKHGIDGAFIYSPNVFETISKKPSLPHCEFVKVADAIREFLYYDEKNLKVSE